MPAAPFPDLRAARPPLPQADRPRLIAGIYGRHILCYESRVVAMWLMRKRPGERQLRENPLVALFPEFHAWLRAGGRVPLLWIYIALALLTLLTYLPSAWHDFIALADYEYIRDNPHVANGFTWQNFLWAFDTGYTGLWQPLTWLSHMRDCQIFGVSPAAQHVNNLLLHTCNVLLLFFALVWFTGDRWCSAFVAALFAIHPLNVEPVAWIAERKDLLGTLFFLLALLAYGQYLERRGTVPYLLLLLIFALGLMTSPIIVTLPFVLLLLDYWPLGYFDIGLELRRILYEKIPLFALSALFCVITFFVHRRNDALSIFDSASFSRRLANVPLSYTRYLGKIFWPANLAIPYHFDQTVTAITLWGAVILLIAITAAALYFVRSKRYLITGWLWFLGTLVPTIGLVQIGAQSMADRYAYIPAIGILIGISWTCADLFALRQIPQRIVAALSAALILACIITTSLQLTVWDNTETLLQHSIQVDPNNYLAFEELGDEFQRQKQTNEKMASYARALQIAPDRAFTRTKVAITLGLSGHLAEAAAQYEIALRSILPLVQHMGAADRLKASDVANNLAWIRATALDPKLRNGTQALDLAKRSIEWSGSDGDAVQLDTLAAAQAQAGQFADATVTARHALALARANQPPQLASEIERHISLYEMGQPYIEFPQ